LRIVFPAVLRPAIRKVITKPETGSRYGHG